LTSDKHSNLVVEQTLGEKLETWYDKNNKWITIVFVVVVAAFVGYRLYDWMHAKNVAKANAAFGQAQQRFDMALQAQEPKDKTDQLQGAITAAEQVVNDYSDKFVGLQAQLLIGNAQYQLANEQPGEQGVANLEKARESYQKYLAMASEPMEQATGKIAVGNVLENLAFIRSDEKLLEEAIASYRDAAKNAEGSYLGAEANLFLARALESSKDAERRAEAKKILDEVAKDRQLADNKKPAAGTEDKTITLTSGQTLSADQVAELKSQAEWSQHYVATEELSQLN